MLKNKYLKQWSCIVSEHLPHLSIPQAIGLATWSFGLVMTKSSSLTQVSRFIGAVNKEKPNTVRQRLKEWYQCGKAKKGEKRSTLEVSSGFAPLLMWVISLLPISSEKIALALDATTIGNKFVVLSINVLLAGCGIPIAWSSVKANQPGSGQPHWQKLLRQIKEAIPTGWTVIVPADRGLYAPWLYQVIVEAGWHPFLRINQQGLVTISSHGQWQPLDALVSAPGQSWSGQVVCFKTNPLAYTLLARWDSGYQEPWLVLTDLSPR